MNGIDEIRASSLAVMPSRLEDLYPWFHEELSWLHLRWNDFCYVYASEPETVDLVNTVAPAFFAGLQEMMWEDMLLRICRLTDPIKSVGKDTLTILRIPSLIPESDGAFRDE